jgi:hypothetical protein
MRRCIYYRLNGQRCGSPAVTGKARCWHHERILERRQRMKVPAIKNAADHQLALMDVVRGLLERRITRDEATATLYALQLMQNNLKLGGLKPSEEMEYQGSLIRQLLNETDVREELEDDAEVLKDKAEFEENLRMKELAEEERRKRQPQGSTSGDTEKAGKKPA